MTDAADPLVGTLLDGRYRVLRRVGAGGHGVVYEAVHVELDARVAIKLVALDGDTDPRDHHDRVRRLLDEGRILVRLRHPQIASALDLGAVEIAGREIPYLVMEWCDGEPLSTALDARRGARMSIDDAFSIVDALAGALAHAHAQGIAHRDVKPSNVIMVGATPRLVDFGIAKLVEVGSVAGSGRTQTESPKSPFTPAYAAPEQAVGARTGPWTDVHALGLLFIQLVTGKRPYGDVPRPTIASVDPNRPTPASFGVDVGPIEGVIARAIALRPSDRHPDAAAFQSDLRRARAALAGLPISEPPPLAVGPYTAPPPAPHVSTATIEPRVGRGPNPSSSPIAVGPRPTDLAPRPSPRDRTAPPSSRTLGQAPARRRPSWLFAAIPLALLIVGAGSSAAYLALSTSTASSVPIAKPPRDKGAPESAGSPCAMTDEIAKARAEKAGWEMYARGAGSNSLTYSLSRGKGDAFEAVTWQIEDRSRIHASGTLRGFVAHQIQSLDARSGLAYGVQGACVVTVHGLARASTAKVFDDLMRGTTWDLVGNTITGPNPASPKAGPASELAQVPLVAKRLSALGRDEFETRVSKLSGIPTVINREASTVSVSMAKGGATKTIVWARVGDASSFGRGLPKSSAFAVDGSIVVYASVIPSSSARGVLEEALAGLGATIQVVP